MGSVQFTSAGGSEQKCPFCAEWIIAKARTCEHCGRNVEPMPVGVEGIPDKILPSLEMAKPRRRKKDLGGR